MGGDPVNRFRVVVCSTVLGRHQHRGYTCAAIYDSFKTRLCIISVFTALFFLTFFFFLTFILFIQLEFSHLRCTECRKVAGAAVVLKYITHGRLKKGESLSSHSHCVCVVQASLHLCCNARHLLMACWGEVDASRISRWRYQLLHDISPPALNQSCGLRRERRRRGQI